MTSSAFRAVSTALAFPLLVALAGCDPQPAATSGTVLTITPSLGAVFNATVVVRDAAGNVVGTGDTGSTGMLTLRATGRGPYVVEVQGDANATYFDESIGGTRPFPAPQAIRALVPVGATQVGVTGLTELAHALWAANSVPLSATNVNLANDAVRQAFAPLLPDLLTPPTVLSSTPAAGDLTTSDTDIYAALLAGLAELGAGEASPALAALAQLRRDIGDGTLDGQENGTPIANLLYAGGITTEFESAVSGRINAWGNTALQGTTLSVAVLTEPSWSTGGSTGGGGTATPNSGLVGVHDLVYNRVTAGGPYTNGQAVQFTVSSSGILMVGSDKIITGPYADAGSTAEIRWNDGGIIYALSNNATGIFNELNVFSGTQFLGYFSEGSGGGGDTLTVSSFSPATRAVGETLIINGTGFDADPFHMQVFFHDNIAATISSSTATQLIVQVPAGAVSGPIRVVNTITGASGTSAASVTVSGGGGSGSTWVSRASPSNFVLTSLAFGNSTFVAAGMGNALLTSADGLSWTARTGPDSNWWQANAVTFDGSLFYLAGDIAFGAPAGVAPLIATSADGITWTRRNWTPGSETQLVDIAASGGTITAVGLNGTIISSTNSGETWSAESQSATSSLTTVASNGSTRVALGRDGSTIILVDTGSGWTTAQSGITDFCPRDVVWSGEYFLAVGGTSCNFGADAAVMQSQDGSNWTRFAVDATAAPAGYTLRTAFVHGDSRVYATGDNNGSAHVIVSSANGSTWRQEYQGSTTGQGQLSGIAASPARIVTVGGTRSVTLP